MFAIAITHNDKILGWISGENHSHTITSIGVFRKISDAIWKMGWVRTRPPYMNVDDQYDLRIIDLRPSI